MQSPESNEPRESWAGPGLTDPEDSIPAVSTPDTSVVMPRRPRTRARSVPVGHRSSDLAAAANRPENELRTPADPEGFPCDSDFPQLMIATNPALMLQMFRSYLKPISGDDYDIQDCEPYRFRCRQSKDRCVMQYTLRIVDKRTGRWWDQAVTGLLYPENGKAERLLREMLASHPRRSVPNGWLAFEPVGLIPELHMLIEIFPYDRRLPNLGSAIGDTPRELDPILLPRLGPGRWRVERRSVEPARYRTERGAALIYTMRARDALSSRSETLRCYLKVYRDEHGAETWQFLRSLSRRPEEDRRPYSVVRPIAYFDELRTLAIEEAPGQPLNEILLQDEDPVETVRLVARAVVAFNTDDLPVTRHESLAVRMGQFRHASRLAQWVYPPGRDAIQGILATVDEGLTESTEAPIHGDMKPDHVFVSGDRVTFIDMDSIVLGDPLRDPAYLVAHLASRAGLDSMPEAQARGLADAVAEEYFRFAPASWRKRFALQCAGAFIEVAVAIFRRQERGWQGRVARIIDLAQETLQASVQ